MFLPDGTALAVWVLAVIPALLVAWGLFVMGGIVGSVVTALLVKLGIVV